MTKPYCFFLTDALAGKGWSRVLGYNHVSFTVHSFSYNWITIVLHIFKTNEVFI